MIRRRNFARTLAAAFLLAVAAALLLLPSAPGHAQTTTYTYVSNIDQGSDDSYNTPFIRGQSFRTGPRVGGYTVTSVDIGYESGGAFSASIYTTNASGHPVSEVAALTPPSSFAAGTLTFTAPANTVLAASTTYSVYFSHGGNSVRLDTTTSDGEDSGKAIGWSIGNQLHRFQDSAWTTPFLDAIRIAIKGTTAPAATNNPATGAPTISGTASVGQTLTAATGEIMDSDGLTSPGYTYQWIRVDGSTEADISGATSSAYTLVAADQGKTIKVKVSFTDAASNAETLTSAATVAVAHKFVDFSDLQSGHTSPIGIWSPDGSTLWVGQWFSTQVYAYNLADETANYSENWTLHNPATASDRNRYPAGIWSDGTYIYVVDDGNSKVFQYNFGDKSLTSNTLSLDSTNGSHNGLWSDGTTAWVSDAADNKLYAYVLSDFSRDSDKDIDLHSDNATARGIWSDGTTIWVVEWDDDKIYAYTLADGVRKADLDITGLDSDGVHYVSIWSDGTTMYVVENAAGSASRDPQIHKVPLPAATNNPATGAPTISGTASVGQTLTAATGEIMDSDGLTSPGYTYQWIRVDGSTEADISGATSSAYTLVAADHGKTIKVKVSFTDAASNAETLTSAATVAVTGSVVWEATLTAPTAWGNSGTTYEGYGSSVNTIVNTSYGTLTPDSFTVGGTTHTVELLAYKITNGDVLYLFTDAGVTKSDLDGSELIITVDGVAKTLAVSDATNLSSGGTNYGIQWPGSVHGYSANDWAGKTITVQLWSPNNLATGAPTISGTATVGQTLTAATSGIMDSDGLTSPTYTYQWGRVDASTEADISGATSSTYTLVDDDEGKTIKVKVSFTDDNNFSETLTSAATSAVTAAVITTYISNLSQGSDNENSSSLVRAQSFRTGSQTGGYAVTHVDIGSDDDQGDSFSAAIYTTNASGHPDSEFAALTPPSSFAKGDLTFTAPANTVLAAGTTYTVRIVKASGASLTLDTTVSDNEDGGGASGWSIGNVAHRQLSGGSWSNLSGSAAIRIAIEGSTAVAINNAATGAPTITGTAEVRQTLTAATSGIMDADGLTSPTYHVPVDPGGQHGVRHPRGDVEHLHPGRRRPRQDDQGQGQLHRRQQQLRDADQRGDRGGDGGGGEQPRDGRAGDQRLGAGGRDAVGGHVGHHGRRRPDQRQLHVPVDPGGRRHGVRHLGGNVERLHPGGRRRGQDDQGQGELHRRRGQRRDADQRGDGDGEHHLYFQPRPGRRQQGRLQPCSGAELQHRFPDRRLRRHPRRHWLRR